MIEIIISLIQLVLFHFLRKYLILVDYEYTCGLQRKRTIRHFKFPRIVLILLYILSFIPFLGIVSYLPFLFSNDAENSCLEFDLENKIVNWLFKKV